jgi:hypothetical protein
VLEARTALRALADLPADPIRCRHAAAAHEREEFRRWAQAQPKGRYERVGGSLWR